MKLIPTLLVSLLFASATSIVSADCPAADVTTPFTGACTLSNIEAQLSCSLSTVGFSATDVKKACDASAL
jgi:hypothetical protein